MNEVRPVKWIEMKLPLVWLLSAAGFVIAGMLGLYLQFQNYGRDINTLTKAVNRLEDKMENRDDRIGVLVQSTIEIKSQLTAQDLRMLRTEADIKEVRHNIEEVRRSQRWMPK